MTTSPNRFAKSQTDSGGGAGLPAILVVAADDQRARFVRSAAGEDLDVVWEDYATSSDVRGLGQAPDITRNSEDATASFAGEGRMQFARDIAERAGRLLVETPQLRLVVIAPPSFALALQHAFGDRWPSLPERVIGRDETRLDDAGLLAFVRTTLDAHPDWAALSG